MKYHFNEPDREIEIMSKMIRKLYPDFNPGKSFCLWLIFNLFQVTDLSVFNGKVSLYDENGSELQIMPEKSSQILRNPYPNKWLTQIGTKYATKRIYGIPIVVDTYYELSQIKDISVEWLFLTPPLGGDRAASGQTVSTGKFLHTHYQLMWPRQVTSGFRWFTLGYNDSFKSETDWYDETMHCDGFMYENKKISPDIILSESDGFSIYMHMINKSFTERLSPYIPWIEEAKTRQIKSWKEIDKSLRDPILFDLFYNEKKVNMKPGPYADLAPESCFGF